MTIPDTDFDSSHFIYINTQHKLFSGELSLTTTNDKNSSSNQVNSITLLDENNSKLGELETQDIRFKKNAKTVIPFDFGKKYTGKNAKQIRIDVGKDDGIDVYKFDISACNTNISHVVPNNKRWIKDKSRLFTFDNAISLNKCPMDAAYLGNGSAYIIMNPPGKSYIDGINFGYTSKDRKGNTITPDFSYIIYGSDNPDSFNEILYNGNVTQGSGTENISSLNYPKPFLHYRLVIIKVSENNIQLSNIEPTFSEFKFESSSPLFREQHFEHFDNIKSSNNELIVPGVITMLFIGMLSMRK